MVQQFSNQPVDSLLYRQFITFKELGSLVSLEYKDDDYNDSINVYVDLYQYLVSIMRFKYLDNSFSISSAIINYAAHIRRYFKTRHRVYAYIVFVNSTMDSKNMLSYVPEYNLHYSNRCAVNKEMKDRIESNMNVVKELIPYIPNVFLKEGSVETSVIIHHLIQTKQIGIRPNLVISNSQLMFQLPLFSSSVVVIRKVIERMINDDKVYSFNHSNCLDAFVYALTNKLVITKINQNTLSFLMALRGIPKRSIKSIIQFRVALKLCEDVPVGSEHDIETLSSIYEDYFNKKKKKSIYMVDTEQFINRLKAIDLSYQYKLYMLMPESKETGFLKQLEDKESVQYINNYYFEKVPLNLDDL